MSLFKFVFEVESCFERNSWENKYIEDWPNSIWTISFVCCMFSIAFVKGLMSFGFVKSFNSH